MMENVRATEARRSHSGLCLEKRVSVRSVPLWLVTWIMIAACQLQAHSGPPFPIVTDRVTGAYRVSVWTDPDVTDDQVKAGRFWVTVQPAATEVVVTIKALDRANDEGTEPAGPVNGDNQRHFVALRLDHEGRYDVHVTLDGASGKGDVDAYTDATYDLRPRPILTLLFLLPFLLAGFVWGKLLIKRRTHGRRG